MMDKMMPTELFGVGTSGNDCSHDHGKRAFATNHRRKLVNLVQKCFASMKGKKIHKSIRAAESDLSSRQESFSELVGRVRKLETTDTHLYEMMYDYEKGLQREFDDDAKTITKNYH